MVEHDLKKAVSALRLDEYRWAIEKAIDRFDLRAIECRLMIDTKLSANEKGQLIATTLRRAPRCVPFHS